MVVSVAPVPWVVARNVARKNASAMANLWRNLSIDYGRRLGGETHQQEKKLLVHFSGTPLDI
jgi:hypothetical protein